MIKVITFEELIAALAMAEKEFSNKDYAFDSSQRMVLRCLMKNLEKVAGAVAVEVSPNQIEFNLSNE